MELLFALLFNFAEAKTKTTPAKTSGKASCSAREIQRQDCRLTLGSYKLQLLPETVSRFDGTWRGVGEVPLKGEGTSWEKMQFDLFRGWPVLQMWIWDKPSGEAGVQQLHWFVGDVSNRNEMQLLATGVVRRRRAKKVEVMEGKPAPKPAYTLDAMEPHSLKLRSDGRLDFVLGRERKIVDKHSIAELPKELRPVDKAAENAADENPKH